MFNTFLDTRLSSFARRPQPFVGKAAAAQSQLMFADRAPVVGKLLAFRGEPCEGLFSLLGLPIIQSAPCYRNRHLVNTITRLAEIPHNPPSQVKSHISFHLRVWSNRARNSRHTLVFLVREHHMWFPTFTSVFREAKVQACASVPPLQVPPPLVLPVDYLWSLV
jgi:hypothetical protein